MKSAQHPEARSNPHDHIARMRKGKDNFEILVDPDKAMQFRRSGAGEITEIVKSEHVYTDAKKGLLQSGAKMTEHFGTNDPLEVSKLIIQKGEIQLSTEYRAKQRDMLHKRVVELLHRNAIDPRINGPHPLPRIEAALAEAKVRIDESKSAEEQLAKIADQLNPILPIRFAVKEIQLVIPKEYAPACHGVIKSYGKILKEGKDPLGNWEGKIEIPGGLETEFYDKINKITHGHTTVQTTKAK